MKNKILSSIYEILFFIDSKLGYVNNYRGESAPYCGFSYSGHTGKITASSYNEGEGEKYCIILLWVICKNTEDKNWYIQTKERFNKYYKRF